MIVANLSLNIQDRISLMILFESLRSRLSQTRNGVFLSFVDTTVPLKLKFRDVIIFSCIYKQLLKFYSRSRFFCIQWSKMTSFLAVKSCFTTSSVRETKTLTSKKKYFFDRRINSYCLLNLMYIIIFHAMLCSSKDVARHTHITES